MYSFHFTQSSSEVTLFLHLFTDLFHKVLSLLLRINYSYLIAEVYLYHLFIQGQKAQRWSITILLLVGRGSPSLIPNEESLMAEWLEQASQGHEMYCHDLGVTSSNPGLVELGVHGTSVPSCT